jgi:hypothetical protein
LSVPYPPPPGHGQQPGYGGPPQSGSAIALTTKFLPLAFFFYLVKPNIAVDGNPVQANWGRVVVPVRPGDHRLDVYTPYFLPPKVGQADLVVNVPPGQTVELEYRAPLIAFSRGSLGAPPQRYNGMWFLIVMLVILVLAVLCACGVALIPSSSST